VVGSVGADSAWGGDLRIPHLAASDVGHRESIHAFEAGFADQAHFTPMLKAAFGITPARYRTLTTRRLSPEPRRFSTINQ
jgi:hypothetical protein